MGALMDTQMFECVCVCLCVCVCVCVCVRIPLRNTFFPPLALLGDELIFVEFEASAVCQQ